MSQAQELLVQNVTAVVFYSQLLMLRRGFRDGGIAAPVHHGEVPYINTVIRNRTGKQASREQRCRSCGEAAGRYALDTSRFRIEDLEEELARSLTRLSQLCTLKIGGQYFDLEYGRIEEDVRQSAVRDLQMCFRIRLGEIDGFSKVSAVWDGRLPGGQ